MKKLLTFLAPVFILLMSASCSSEPQQTTLGAGKQPKTAIDSKGVVRVVYGADENILCATSRDNGISFSEPVVVGEVGEMHLGMTRGPQIASSAHHSFITAMDKKGNIHSFKLNHDSDRWKKVAAVNDVPGSAPEGLMSIATDDDDNFYAVWLDVRENQKNKIVFASATGASSAWAKNKVVYVSPDFTVCECCKPSIATENGKVNLMFRNWLKGSRDLYLASSSDKGHTFSQLDKLGAGTWKLQGCPMDGGGVTIDSKHQVHTVWQREKTIFYAQPGEQEIEIGKGRNCSISGKSTPVMSWQDGSDMKVKLLNSPTGPLSLGEGTALKTAELQEGKILCVFEKDGEIKLKRI